nr:hypothetical protein CFP56_75376 [Quercus suber]
MGRDKERREQTHPSPALPPPLRPITSSMSSAPPPVLKFSKLSFSVPEPEDLLLCALLSSTIDLLTASLPRMSAVLNVW